MPKFQLRPIIFSFLCAPLFLAPQLLYRNCYFGSRYFMDAHNRPYRPKSQPHHAVLKYGASQIIIILDHL